MLKNLILTKFWSKMSGDQAQHIFQTFYGAFCSLHWAGRSRISRWKWLKGLQGTPHLKSPYKKATVPRTLCTPTQDQRGSVRWEVLTNTPALLIPPHREHLETHKSVCLVRTGNVHLPSKCRFSKAVLLGQLKEGKLPTLSYCMAFCYTEITNSMKNSILAD